MTTYEELYCFGAGGHGKVVADLAQCAGLVVRGFVDDDPSLPDEVLGLPVAGNRSWLVARASEVSCGVLLGVGSGAVRERLFDELGASRIAVVTAVHPAATIAASATLGAGAVVMAKAVINPDSVVGIGAIINTAAVVEHDCVVGDFAHVSPNSVMGGTTRLGRRSQLGIGATILPNLSVGSGTVIGGGAVVTRDIGDGVVALGVPAKVRPARDTSAG